MVASPSTESTGLSMEDKGVILMDFVEFDAVDIRAMADDELDDVVGGAITPNMCMI
jgi:hypothetical protein